MTDCTDLLCAEKDVDSDGDIDLADVKRWLDKDNDGAVEAGEIRVVWPVLLWLLGQHFKLEGTFMKLTGFVVLSVALSGNLSKGNGLGVSSAYDLDGH